jgi:hypothetical protein
MTPLTVSIDVIRAIRIARAKALKRGTTVPTLTDERREWTGR